MTNSIANFSVVLGQSNAMNFGTLGVPYPGGWVQQPLNGGYSDIIWNVSTQGWEQYGAGTNSCFDPNLSSCWGPETGISLARRAYTPQRATYWVKFAVGGVGLARNPSATVNDWSPYSQGKAFTQAMAQFNAAVVALAPYRSVVVDAIYWIGNETDTQDATSAAAMARDLPAFAAALRAQMNAPDAKFIIALCKEGAPNGPYTDQVRAAQIACGSLRRNGYVETNGLTWGGVSVGHYDPGPTVVLGTMMAAEADTVSV